jgi:hypothetical protein
MWLERFAGSEEVIGSNPIFSTIKASESSEALIFDFFYRKSDNIGDVKK